MSDSHASGGRYDGLAEIARSMPNEPSSTQLVRGWQRIRAESDKRSRSSRGVWMATGMAAAMAASAVAVVALQGRGDAPLTYVVQGGMRGPGGEVASTDDATSKVAFSDGTELALMPHARANVGELGANGARVALQEGQVEVHVQHRPNARWLVGAGPFVVTVTGTSFSLAWKENDRFEVRMHSGTVVVKGPMIEEGRSLSGGQSLSIRLAAKEISLGDPTVEAAGGPDTRAVPEPAPLVESPPPPVEPVGADENRGSASRPHPARVTSTGWSGLLAHGKVSDIITDAESRGVDTACAQLGLDDLAALADAARYVRRGDIARRALSAQRTRFPRSPSARDAAFFLGRLDETDGASSSAMSWYQKYLDEAPGGSYASEALGREMALVVRLQGKAQALPLAERYLNRFPTGAYAASARSLLGRP